MVRSEEDDHVDRAVAGLVPAVGADLAGVDVSGVGNDDGQGAFRQGGQGVCQEGG
jgi:hypothetical protein